MKKKSIVVIASAIVMVLCTILGINAYIKSNAKTELEFVVYEESRLFSDEELATVIKNIKKTGWVANLNTDISLNAYTHYYFKNNKYKVQIKEKDLTDEDKALKYIANNFALKVCDKPTLKEIIKGNRGYLFLYEWGGKEENYKGHILNMMVSIKDCTIWWAKCS